MPLREQIEALSAKQAADFSADDRVVLDEFKAALNRGEIRAAERSGDGTWQVNAWVKQGILVGFRMGRLVDMSGDGLRFFDKDTYPIRRTTVADNERQLHGVDRILT